MKIQHKTIILFTFMILLILVVQNAHAVPAFARRYKISCNTCHAPFPRLKPYGDEFAGNGFIMKEEEKARDYISAGDDMLWLNKTFPIGVRFDAYGVADDGNDVESDLQTPWGLKLLSGGTLTKNIGYYFYFYMSERGEVAGIEDAYIHFDNVFGSPLDIMVGQFQTSDPLMKRELRLTFEDYEIYKTRVGMSGTNLAYDRGVMLVYGIEKTGTDLIGLVVNGNGKPDAGDDKKFDNDSYKNIGFRISQGVGDFASVGAYYYSGKEKVVGGGEWTNEVSYWGPDFNIGAGPMDLTFQYLVRKDSDPLFNDGGEIETTGIVTELVFSPKLDRSRFYMTALYNKIESDLEYMEYETATISGTYMIARNLRLIVEYTRDLYRDANRFVLGTVSGF